MGDNNQTIARIAMEKKKVELDQVRLDQIRLENNNMLN